MAAQLDTRPKQAVERIGPLPPVAVAVSVMRRRVRAILAAWNVSPEIVDDALLVVSELLTNSIVHALPPAELRLSWRRRGGRYTLRIAVTDAGPGPAAGHWPLGTDPDEHGRGTEVVHALATKHGIRIHSGGITRWADLVAE
ncbi:ATP-binding protein [Streptomyces sp. NPDC058964]|uniref:ATP-binding protein n=1 Tax=Streptomyces sp. NPDC058964 TaxID=3346681 RepID=UPI0036AE89A0